MRTIARRSVLWQVVVVMAVGTFWVWGMVRPGDASAVTDACKLLSAGEIEAVVGGKVSIPPRGQLADPKSGMPSSCSIKIGNGPDNVAVMVMQGTSDSGMKSGLTAGDIEAIKKQGFKYTEEKSGDTFCSTLIPPASHRPTDPRSMGFLTSCGAGKGGGFVGVNVSVHSEGKMIPISKLRPLAKKAASRL